jgi:hypothetical protein
VAKLTRALIRCPAETGAARDCAGEGNGSSGADASRGSGSAETREDLRRGLQFWVVKDKLFVWERPLRKSDLRALGESAPQGPILGARVEHEVAKNALIADNPEVFFTIPHFDGYSAVLVLLEKIALDELEEVIVEAWLARAPRWLADAYVEERFPDAG